MNLFKKQKFSIRKFSVGIFSTVIATLTFLSHPGHAATQEEESNSSQTTSQNVKSQTIDKSINNNDKYIDSENNNGSVNDLVTNQKINNEIKSKVENINDPKNIDNRETNNLSRDNNQSTVSNEGNPTTENLLKNESNHITVNKNNLVHKRTKRSTDTIVTNNQDQMSLNETNSGQIVNGTFTDTSNGAVIPTNQTVSEMNQASKITGWHVKDNDQTVIPLIWGPKALPPYNPYVFDKTKNKIAAVLSKYPSNVSGVAADKTVGPIYQDIDVTPGSEI